MRLFFMNSGQTRARLVKVGAALSAAALIAGCGSAYRSVITPINPSGPAAQPSSLALVVSAPSTTTPGIVTVLDYSGDTVMAQAPIGPGPTTFSVDSTGSYGYTFNSDGTLTNFPVSNTLQAKSVQYTTLATGAQPINFFSPSAGLWAADPTNGDIDVFTGYPQSFKQVIPVAATPVMILGLGSIGERNYALSQVGDFDGIDCNNPATFAAAPLGYATPIETSNTTADTPIPVGKCPVYGVMSPDGRRMFVLNRGDDTISVINVQTNILDKCPVPLVITPPATLPSCPAPYNTNQLGQPITYHPVMPLSLNAVNATGITPPNGTTGMTPTAGPVYAEYNQATNQLVVSNYDGATVSIIDVSLDQFGNDSATFGTTYTVPVGNNPASVTVLYDGSRAYTANQGTGTAADGTVTNGTVTVIDLSSHTVEKTLQVVGHPRTVVSTQNSTYGKVYVASPDSPYLTILTTVTDLVDTTVLVEGNVVDVRVTTQNGSSGNANNVSRRPGYGQPCYLPPSLLGLTPSLTLTACNTLPTAAQ
jgi:DNA-binding beta-propeller fold protein YncE